MSSVYVSENVNVNTFSPGFRLDVEHLLQHFSEETDHHEEVARVS